MAAGGFAAGMFLGLGAFDDSINSEQKVWTTAALLGAAGGVAGWWAARKIDYDFSAPGLGHIKPETRKAQLECGLPARRPFEVLESGGQGVRASAESAHQTGNRSTASILSDIDRIYPSYLSPSTVDAKKIAANANREYSLCSAARVFVVNPRPGHRDRR